MGNTRDTLRKNIEKYISLSPFSQKEIAEKLGVSKSSITNWVKGKNSPDVEVLADLCDLLGVSISAMYDCNIAETKKAPEISPEGKFDDIIEMLGKLCPEQVGEVRGYIKRMVHENEAAETAKQISSQLA